MIQNVRTEGFKGFDINEPVPLKAVYTGKNKSGKSTRAGAIAIALYGYIPFSTAGKRPGDILDSFGKDSLIAAVTVGGTEFARKFSRNSKGGVSQSVQVGGKRSSAENFAILLDRAGSPRIANVAEFMKQSEAKKIDTLFALFPNDELAGIDTEIEKAKEDVSKFEKKISGVEATVIRLTGSKQDVEIPSGSISETQAGIKTIETQISDTEEQIKQAEIEEAKEKAKSEAKEELEKEAAEKKVDPVDAVISSGEQQIADYKDSLGFGGDQDILGKTPAEPQIFIDPMHDMANQTYARESILRIIDALNGAGCGTCAALIVVKQELKKFKEVS